MYLEITKIGFPSTNDTSTHHVSIKKAASMRQPRKVQYHSSVGELIEEVCQGFYDIVKIFDGLIESVVIHIGDIVDGR